MVLYACYSGFRETTLTYNLKDGGNEYYGDAKIYNADENYKPLTTRDGRTIETLFKDFLDLGDDDAALEPNTPYTVGTLQNGGYFTAVREGYRLVGWSTNPDADPQGGEIIPQGTRVKVNTINDDTENTLYAIWELRKLPVRVFTYEELKEARAAAVL